MICCYKVALSATISICHVRKSISELAKNLGCVSYLNTFPFVYGILKSGSPLRISGLTLMFLQFVLKSLKMEKLMLPWCFVGAIPGL